MIKQVRFSKAVRFFEQGMCKRWGVTTYKDPDAPCLFAGVYNKKDVSVINKHRGLKVVWNNGRVRPNLFLKLNPKNLVVCKYTDSIDHSMLEGKYRIKNARFEIKDYSLFSPTPLGDSICVYLGSEGHKHGLGYEQVEQLKKITQHPILYSWAREMTRAQLKERIYNNCFVYFKPAIVGGVETANELALMGRKTVSNAKDEYYIPYDSIEHAAQIIDKEAEKIGTMVGSVLNENYFYTGEEWMQEEFWLT